MIDLATELTNSVARDSMQDGRRVNHFYNHSITNKPYRGFLEKYAHFILEARAEGYSYGAIARFLTKKVQPDNVSAQMVRQVVKRNGGRVWTPEDVWDETERNRLT